MSIIIFIISASLGMPLVVAVVELDVPLLMVVPGGNTGLAAVLGGLLVCAPTLQIEMIAVIPKQTLINEDGCSFMSRILFGTEIGRQGEPRSTRISSAKADDGEVFSFLA